MDWAGLACSETDNNNSLALIYLFLFSHFYSSGLRHYKEHQPRNLIHHTGKEEDIVMPYMLDEALIFFLVLYF
jgi:hypothetical protein